MSHSVNPEKRPYHSPLRDTAAAQTRLKVLRAAAARFERCGWSGTTVASVAVDAGVSPKTVGALFATKATLLSDTVTFAIRGDDDATPMSRRPTTAHVEAAADAATMIERHVAYAAAVTGRSSRLAGVVETAALGDSRVAELWERMTHNHRFGARWAAESLLAKPGVRPGLELEEAFRIFLVAIDWGTWRLLTGELGLSAIEAEAWLSQYDQRMLLAPTTCQRTSPNATSTSAVATSRP